MGFPSGSRSRDVRGWGSLEFIPVFRSIVSSRFTVFVSLVSFFYRFVAVSARISCRCWIRNNIACCSSCVFAELQVVLDFEAVCTVGYLSCSLWGDGHVQYESSYSTFVVFFHSIAQRCKHTDLLPFVVVRRFQTRILDIQGKDKW